MTPMLSGDEKAKLSALWDKFVAGHSLSSAETDLVCSLAASGDSYCQFIGRLVESKTSLTREQKIALFETECLRGIGATSTYAHALLFFMMGLSGEVLTQNRIIRQYVFSSITKGNKFCRMNAAHLLREMASSNDREALELLATAAHDTDGDVKANAAAILAGIR